MDPENSDTPAPLAALFAKVRENLSVPTPERDAEIMAERAAEHAREERARLVARWTRIGIPKRLWDVVASPKDNATLTATREWLASDKSILVLVGLPDHGKTAAACIAADEVRNAKVVKAIEVVRRGMFDNDFWDDVYASSLVVLDDLGTEPLDEKGYALANLAALIDRAYDGEPRLIITSNLPLGTFSDKYLTHDGGRSLQRVRERGAVVECIEGPGFYRPASVSKRTV